MSGISTQRFTLVKNTNSDLVQNFSGTISFTSGTAASGDNVGIKIWHYGKIESYKTGSGTFYTNTVDNLNWYYPNYYNIGSYYYLRFTTQSGSTISGTSIGTWSRIYDTGGGYHTYYVTKPSLGSRTGTLLIEVSLDQSTILSSGTIVMSTIST